MKCQILFSWENSSHAMLVPVPRKIKKHTISLSTAELAQIVVKIKC